MKPGPSNASVPLTVIITAAALVLCAPAALHGQQTPAAAPAPQQVAPAAPAPDSSHNLGSLVGITMVSLGGLMVLSVVARSFKWTRRTRKPYYPPVLFDRLNQNGIARLQETINRAPSMRPRTYLYERTEPEHNLVFDEPVEEMQDHEQPAEADQTLQPAAVPFDDTPETAY